MKNSVYEAPKALILNVNVCDVITTSGGGLNNMFNDAEKDILIGGWFAAELDQ